MSRSTPQWRRSSYSTAEGGQCVEVAALWQKSSYSGAEGGQCVEVAVLAPEVGLRDSKDPDGPHLHVTRPGFAELLVRLKA
ncbi:DUF397 domain-containing protein [Actinomadura oligospora]|uniref:DUF397 domain-containing protein n=1 Tax=Actinomadura oligospora TaxID=111804 RepID=UPI0009FD1CE3|nr:DUF397 domain-containing protein [Actinomadura oligospora]